MDQDKQQIRPEEEPAKGGESKSGEAAAMEEAQKDAAEERENERGYQ